MKKSAIVLMCGALLLSNATHAAQEGGSSNTAKGALIVGSVLLGAAGGAWSGARSAKNKTETMQATLADHGTRLTEVERKLFYSLSPVEGSSFSSASSSSSSVSSSDAALAGQVEAVQARLANYATLVSNNALLMSAVGIDKAISEDVVGKPLYGLVHQLMLQNAEQGKQIATLQARLGALMLGAQDSPALASSSSSAAAMRRVKFVKTSRSSEEEDDSSFSSLGDEAEEDSSASYRDSTSGDDMDEDDADATADRIASGETYDPAMHEVDAADRSTEEAATHPASH